jgi:4-oxalocrotonate tautomerase
MKFRNDGRTFRFPRSNKGDRHAHDHCRLCHQPIRGRPQSGRCPGCERSAAQFLHKDPNVTAVTVQAVDPADWFCAGHSLAHSGLAAFWLEIRITEGTNTKDEKAAFIAAVFKRMGELLGPLHEISYVYAHDARADGYGFSGVTQERRYVAGKLGAKLSVAA